MGQSPRCSYGPILEGSSGTTRWGAHLAVCMWDGATRSGSHSADIILIKDQGGESLWSKEYSFLILMTRETILWCLELGFTEMRFEGDAKVVIDKVNQADTCDSKVGSVLE
ncbi:unnamed protein product [Linum trigynum]|uniref:RNase H type-1 domain-containing protein n=1 Tax=Linum trigynum TaxID=586398 RepID=A0AAV2GU07_9ROSI